jgi:hypothetical protein
MKKAPAASITCIEGRMRTTFLLGLVFAVGLLPRASIAEIALPSAYEELAFGYPSLDGSEVSHIFEKSFGAKEELRYVRPLLTSSRAGRPTVVYSFDYNGDQESLALSSREAGRSLREASEMFEAGVRRIACAGLYGAFLDAGGSLQVELTAFKLPKRDDPIRFFGDRVGIAYFEVKSIDDCEAL